MKPNEKPTGLNYLLTKLMEEAGEVIQETAKCTIFGPNEVYPEIPIPNALRVMMEVVDLQTVVEMLQEAEVLPIISLSQEREWKTAKRAKLEKYFGYSQECKR